MDVKSIIKETICKQCNAENISKAKFCTTCGTNLQSPTKKQKLEKNDRISDNELKKLKTQLAKGEITSAEFKERQYTQLSTKKPNKQDLEKLSKKGYELESLNKHEDAIKYFNKALVLEPKKINLLMLKARSLYNLNKFKSAIFYFDEVLKIEPNNTEALCKKGQTLTRKNKFDDAVLIFDIALGINPKNIEVLKQKGHTLMERSYKTRIPQIGGRGLQRFIGKQIMMCKVALSCFDKALKINSKDIDALNGKGDALSRLGAYGHNKRNSYYQAIKHYDKVLKIESGNYVALNNKGNAVVNAKEWGWFKKAISCYDQILKKDHQDISVICNKGYALFKKGKKKEAIILYDKALSIDPSYKPALERKNTALSKR